MNDRNKKHQRFRKDWLQLHRLFRRDGLVLHSLYNNWLSMLLRFSCSFFSLALDLLIVYRSRLLLYVSMQTAVFVFPVAIVCEVSNQPASARCSQAL